MATSEPNPAAAVPPATAASPRDPTRALLVFALLVACFVLYAPSLGNEFVWDDPDAAMGNGGGRRNPLVDEVRPLGDYLLGNWWPQRNPHCHTYRPLTTLSFALRTAVFGDDARAAHLLNVLLHVLTVGLCLRLLLAVGASFAAAWLGALVFGLHALHSESVLNIVGAAELIAFAAGAGGTLCLLRAVGARGAAAGWWTAAALSFTAAYFAKESALAWVGMAPLCLVVARRAQSAPAAWSRARGLGVALVLAGPALLFLVLRARMLAALPPGDPGIAHLDNPLVDLPTLARLGSAAIAWGHGLLLTVLPLRLQVDYGPSQLPVVTALDDPWLIVTAFALVALGALAWTAVRELRRRPLLALGAAAFLGFSFVVSNVPMPAFMMFAERVYFTPTLGAAFAAAWLVDRVAKAPRWQPALLLLLGGWLGASAQVAWERNEFWRDDRTIIERGVADSPSSVRLQLCAGVLAVKDGELVAARRHFERAALLDPAAPQPWLELARLAIQAGDGNTAAAALARARAGRPREVARYAADLAALQARLAPATPR